VAEVAIEARRRGENVWHALPVVGKEHAVTVLDDDLLSAGTYEIRGRAIDAVGNERSTAAWPSGAPVLVQLPTRLGSRMTAGMRASRSKKGTVRLDPRPLVPFGKAVTLRGVLTDETGRARPGATVHVSELTATAGAAWRPVAALRTDRSGGFVYRARSGVSRTVRFAYAATPTARSASIDVTIRVRATSTLTANRRRLRNGDTVTLRGTVKGRPIPHTGKLVILQARIPGGWRTFGTARAHAESGRWAYRYTFTQTPTTSRYRFRVLVPQEEGFPFTTGSSPLLQLVVRGSD
jgi:hypothetical protein